MIAQCHSVFKNRNVSKSEIKPHSQALFDLSKLYALSLVFYSSPSVCAPHVNYASNHEAH